MSAALRLCSDAVRFWGAQYIQWRYAIGEDREALTKVNRKINDEDQKDLNAIHVIDGEKRQIEKLASRRKLKRSYEVRNDTFSLPLCLPRFVRLHAFCLRKMRSRLAVNRLRAPECAQGGD